MQMNDRVVELSSLIRGALEDEIPEVAACHHRLLGASVEATSTHFCTRCVTTSRWIESRRRQRLGMPPPGPTRRRMVNALVRAYRLGQRQLTTSCSGLREADISPATRLAALEAA